MLLVVVDDRCNTVAVPTGIEDCVSIDIICRTESFAQRYLSLLVDKIEVDGMQATLQGSYRKLTDAIAQTKMDTSKEVPIFMLNWRARRDSNARPLPSEGSTLSS
jgi:hypothetical protein